MLSSTGVSGSGCSVESRCQPGWPTGTCPTPRDRDTPYLSVPTHPRLDLGPDRTELATDEQNEVRQRKETGGDKDGDR